MAGRILMAFPEKRAWSAAVLFCCLLINSSGGILADVIHPAYLNMQEVEPGVFDVVWKVPLRYQMRLPVDPVFPSHCRDVSERTTETFPNAVIERWRIECGQGGFDGEIVEIAGLSVTLIDAFVQIEMHDGRIYKRLLRGAAPRFTVEPRKSPIRIARENVVFGLRHIIRKMPVILLVLAAVLYFGNSWMLVITLAAFAVGYSLSLFGNAFTMIETAAGWGTAAVGISALCLSTGSIGERSDNRYVFAASALLVAGLLFGAALGGEWGGEGLAYLDIPFAAAALLIGVLTGLFLLSGLPLLFSLVVRDLRIDRIRILPALPAYISGALAVFLILQSTRGLTPAGMIQPYLRMESTAIALAGGFWLGNREGRQSFLSAFCLIAFTSAGSLAGFAGLDLPLTSAAIPLSIAITGIAMLSLSKGRLFAGILFCCIAGFYHGWINSNWLIEHVNTILPSATGGIILFIAALVIGVILRRSLPLESAGRWARAGGIALITWSFWMRLSGYRVSEFREISVSAAGGVHIPLVSLVLLAGALFVFRRSRRRSAIPVTALLLGSLILVPYGGFALGGGPGSLVDMSDDDAAALISGLLENTYHAVNLRGEEEIYDRLAMSVHGELVESIYLESRRRSVMPGQADTEAKLIGVQVREVTGRTPERDGTGYSFTCTWLVTGTVRHWAHKHNRLNRYNGIITIRAVDDLWKISGLELLDEARQM